MAERFEIKSNYQSSNQVAYFEDVANGITYQPDVYSFAKYCVERGGISRVIDVGAGNGIKLQEFAAHAEVVAIDTGTNLERIRMCGVISRIFDVDLEFGLPDEVLNLCDNAMVICSDVIEHLMNPIPLLKSLNAMNQRAAFVLISTPDRVRIRGIGDFGPPPDQAHKREWSIDEFDSLLRRIGFADYFIGYTINADITLWKSTIMVIGGTWATRPRVQPAKCLALIAVHNDADILAMVIRDLERQGVDSWIIDDWSQDGSYELAQQLKSSTAAVIAVERFGSSPSVDYDWAGILRRKEEIAEHARAYDWVIHHDSDELREAPWQNVNMAEALARVGELGFNAVDHTVIDFRPIRDGFSNIHDPAHFFSFYEFGLRPGHFLQIKAWRRSVVPKVQLVASGGHTAIFGGLRVFPLKFLLKHYPLRSIVQSHTKLNDRAQRVEREKRQRGWHGQYDKFIAEKKSSFLWQTHLLMPYNPKQFPAEFLIERLSGIGILR